MINNYKNKFFLLSHLLFSSLFFIMQDCTAAPSSLDMASYNTKYLLNHPLKIKKNNTKKSREKVNGNVRKKQKLTASDNDDNKPWSNAFNFAKTLGTQVDPRTGVLSAFIKTGSMVSNLGHGPDINLQINYSSISTANPDGLAEGWSWNLTHFNPKTNQLTTSLGQNFHLVQQSDDTWQPQYHKLKDISITGNKTTHFKITYANGLREILNHEGYETRLEQQNGWGVNFIYVPGTHLLQSITDDQNHKIIFNWNENYINVISAGTDGQPVAVRIDNNNNQINRVFLPQQSNAALTAIQITYIGNMLTKMSYPSGLKKAFTYNCNSAVKFSMEGDRSFGTLCAVSRETVIHGAVQPNSVINYKYSQANSNGHDYLGYNSGLALLNRSDSDALFKTPVDYTYQTSQDNGLIKEIHTYDKYHLLIRDRKVSDRTEHLLSETDNFYCRTDRLNGCAHTSFENLPATYSLPLKVVTKRWGDNTSEPAVDSIDRMYDDQGRIISNTDNYGRTTKTIYCPYQGDKFCPETPKTWRLNTLLEKVTTYPAKRNEDSIDLPIVVYNHYRKLVNYIGKDYLLVPVYQEKHSGSNIRTITRSYYTNPSDLLSYGLLKKITKGGNAQGSLTSVTKDYRYTASPDGHSKTTYSSIELAQNKLLPLPTVTTSMFTNQRLQYTDATGKNITRYHYDEIGRLIQTDMHAGTQFLSHVHYQYTLSPTLNEVIITKGNGLRHKLIMDSEGRQIMDFREPILVNGKADHDHWVLKNKATYDNYERLTDKYSYFYDLCGKLDSLQTTYHYDDMGAVNQTDLPDGEIVTKHYDDPYRCQVSYRQNRQGERSVISIIVVNKINKPVQKIILPATQKVLPSLQMLCMHGDKQPGAQVTTIRYDGFGRAVMITDPEGNVIHRNYNSLGKITDMTNPVGDKIHYVYNLTGQIIQTWVLPVSGGRYLLSSAQYSAAGQLLWKAGEDGKHITYTYFSDGKPQSVIMPNKHIITWKYNSIDIPVTTYIDGHSQLHTDYDPVTVLPIQKSDITGVTTLSYSDDGLLLEKKHTGSNGYQNYQFQWQYDKNRRMVSRTDIHGNKTFMTYDRMGRITAAYYKKQLLFTNVYDDFSRRTKIIYGSQMQRDIDYDAYGHPYHINDTLNGQLLSGWYYTYDKNGNIIQIKRQGDNNKQAVIHYDYDKLDNLVAMSCDGSSGLPLCPRDTAFANSGLKSAPIITRQKYTFTPLNRIAQVQETLQNSENNITLSKLTRYDYSDFKVPLRLQHVNIVWNKSQSAIKNIIYDSDGNMKTDGQGNQINYNVFNQITHIEKTNGRQSFYTYDGSGKEVMEKTQYDIRYLFYCNGSLVNERVIDSDQVVHTAGYYGVARTIDGVIDQYYEHNYKGDVVSVLKKDAQNDNRYLLNYRNIYSPYGMSWHSPLSSSEPFYKCTLFGFDGERTDFASGWQFLGAGHRTYNPQQRYFVSEDPYGDGYSFGSNNPVMKTDPDGNFPRWLGKVMGGFNDVFSLGIAAIHKKWAHITSSVVMAGLAVAAAGMIAANVGGALAAAGAMISTAALNSVSVAAAAIPTNKGLNIAAAVVGAVNSAIIIATGIYMLGGVVASGFGSAELIEDTAEESVEVEEEIDTTAAAIAARRPLLVSVDEGKYMTEGAIQTMCNNEQLTDTLTAVHDFYPQAESTIDAALIVSKITGVPIEYSSVMNFNCTLTLISGYQNESSRGSFGVGTFITHMIKQIKRLFATYIPDDLWIERNGGNIEMGFKRPEITQMINENRFTGVIYQNYRASVITNTQGEWVQMSFDSSTNRLESVPWSPSGENLRKIDFVGVVVT